MADDDRNVPNQASNKTKAEGERWSSDPDTVERADRNRPRSGEAGAADEGSGITNRPLEEERHNQEAVPDRGTAREGSHAGRGDDAARERPGGNEDR